MFPSILKASLLGKAQKKGLVEICLHDLRDYATDKHRQVDDVPYGGGAGMVLKTEPVVKALEDVAQERGKIRRIFFTPQGRLLTATLAREWASYDQLILLCGRYEGVDERVMDSIDEEVSIGDYILSGGELAVMIFIDVVSRFCPGVVGDARSVEEETFENGLLKAPQYTRPESFRDVGVPSVLLSGHHEHIKKWQRQQSLERTLRKRPDLLEKAELTDEERRYIRSLQLNQ